MGLRESPVQVPLKIEEGAAVLRPYKGQEEASLRDGKKFSEASRYIAENPNKWEWGSRESPKEAAVKDEGGAAVLRPYNCCGLDGLP